MLFSRGTHRAVLQVESWMGALVLQHCSVPTGGMERVQSARQETGHAQQSLTLVLYLCFSVQKSHVKLGLWVWLTKRKKKKIPFLYKITKNSSHFLNLSVTLSLSLSHKHAFTMSRALPKFFINLASVHSEQLPLPKGTVFLGFSPSHPLCRIAASSQIGSGKRGQIKLSPASLWVSLQKCLMSRAAVCQKFTECIKNEELSPVVLFRIATSCPPVHCHVVCFVLDV